MPLFRGPDRGTWLRSTSLGEYLRLVFSLGADMRLGLHRVKWAPQTLVRLSDIIMSAIQLSIDLLYLGLEHPLIQGLGRESVVEVTRCLNRILHM